MPIPFDPLILTARFDADAAVTFQRLRDRQFPARLNIVPAHCTLFHHLPGAAIEAVAAALAEIAAKSGPIPFATAGLRFLGRGVAIELEAAGLVALRRRLAGLWTDDLTAQDRQGFKPHVTVQNKVGPAEARALRDELAAAWVPFAGCVEGLDLWRYRGGPWALAQAFTFRRSTEPELVSAARR